MSDDIIFPISQEQKAQTALADRLGIISSVTLFVYIDHTNSALNIATTLVVLLSGVLLFVIPHGLPLSWSVASNWALSRGVKRDHIKDIQSKHMRRWTWAVICAGSIFPLLALGLLIWIIFKIESGNANNGTTTTTLHFPTCVAYGLTGVSSLLTSMIAPWCYMWKAPTNDSSSGLGQAVTPHIEQMSCDIL